METRRGELSSDSLLDKNTGLSIEMLKTLDFAG